MANSELIQSVLKALDAVRLLTESDRPLRLSDIAAALNQKPSTVHNLLRTLRARGYVEQDAAGFYFAGPAPAELYEKTLRRNFFCKAGSFLQELAVQYPDAVLTLAELTPSAISVRLRISPDRPGELQHPVALTLRPNTLVTTRCLQALASNAPLYESTIEQFEITPALQQERELIRKQRYAWQGNGFRFAAAFFVPDNFSVGFSSDSSGKRLLQQLAGSVRQFIRQIINPKEISENG